MIRRFDFCVVDVDASVPLAMRRAYAAAQQIQLREHIAPAWQGDTTMCVRVATPEAPPLDGEVEIRLLRDPTQAGAIGFHDQKPDGTPIAYVFVQLAEKLGKQWTTVASHEVAEIVGDPRLRLCVEFDDGFWDREICFTGDTKVPLLNGTDVAIADLVGWNEFWVYSCTSDGKIKAGRGHSARCTQRDAEVVEVLLDDGSHIKCTPSHQFMLRDGSYCAARDLAEGASLMPLYRRREVLYGDSDYEQVMVPETGEWEFTHRIIEKRCPPGYVRHHIDFNRFNNEPSNLRVMKRDEHIALHGSHTRERNLQWAAEGRHPWQRPKSEVELQRSRDQIIAYNKSDARMLAFREWYESAIADGSHPMLQPRNDAQRVAARQNITAYNKSDAHRETAARVGSETLKVLWQQPQFVTMISALNGERMREQMQDPAFEEKRKAGHALYFASLTDEERKKLADATRARNSDPEFKQKRDQGRADYYANLSDEDRAKRSRSSSRAMHVRWHDKRNLKKPDCEWCAIPNNHKVVSAKSDGRADVYDFTVDSHHNFALSAGVFVHNCDRVENDQYAVTVTVDGAQVSVWLSNFNYPSAFEPPKAPAPDEKYDYMGLSKRPNEVRPGGYAQKFDPKTGWVQVGQPSAYRMLLKSMGLGRGARREARNPVSWWRRVLTALGL